MASGRVRWYNAKKGFGFIAGAGGPDVFIHSSAIQGQQRIQLQEGDEVEYEVVQGEKGPKAAKVIRLNPQPPGD